jgi:hypothetical protein
LVEVNGDYGAYKKGNMWAEPDIDESADYMRRVFDNRGEAETVGERGRYYITRFNSVGFVREQYGKRLNKILERYETENAEEERTINELSALNPTAPEIYLKLKKAFESNRRNAS